MDRPFDQSFAFMFAAVQKYLTDHETQCIIDQFGSKSWLPNRQVLWESVDHAEVEAWAKHHGMQTLSIALGPLVEEGNPRNLRAGMSPARTQKFMRGAGALFTWYISLGDELTILCRPPPGRFHPGHHTNFQQNELPILRTAIENLSLNVYMVHPEIKKAEGFSYQVWPQNEVQEWNDKYGDEPYTPRPWRIVSERPIQIESLEPSAISKVNNIFMRLSMQQMTQIMQHRLEHSIAELCPCSKRKQVIQSPGSTAEEKNTYPTKAKIQLFAEIPGNARKGGNKANDSPQQSGKSRGIMAGLSIEGARIEPNKNKTRSKKETKSKQVPDSKQAPNSKKGPNSKKAPEQKKVPGPKKKPEPKKGLDTTKAVKTKKGQKSKETPKLKNGAKEKCQSK